METEKLAFDAIGTRWEIQLNREVEADGSAGLLKRIRAWIEEFDKAYSRFRPDSLVTAISKRPGSHALPADGFDLLRFYERLYQATDGQVTPLIGQVLADAGYDAEYSFQQKALKRPPRWEDVISYDRQHIEVKQPVLLDFGAAGKGYLVDILGEIIQEAGIRDFTINAGGDILHRATDAQSIEVGLENPMDDSEAIGIAKLCNQSLCASSGSKRKWGNLHHIINPSTLRPAEEVIATWVIANDTMTADGLATALFFTNARTLSANCPFSYAILNRDMNLSYAKDFPVQIFEAAHE